MRPVASARRAGFNIDQPERVKLEAAEITRQSKSNLALAFISLGRERRRDITVFYAFCRVIDDIADATDLSTEEKRRLLVEWRRWLHAATPEEPELPQEDLARFDYPEAELRDRQYNDRFIRLMEFEAARAREFFTRAAGLLPREDRRSMVAAEIMASVYGALLRRIELDKFRVFEKNYRLSKLEKAGRIAAQLFKSI